MRTGYFSEDGASGRPVSKMPRQLEALKRRPGAPARISLSVWPAPPAPPAGGVIIYQVRAARRLVRGALPVSAVRVLNAVDNHPVGILLL